MKWASRGLALLLPAVFLALSIGALSSTEPVQKSQERQRMEALLSSQETRVLVLSNAMAVQYVDLSELASGLGLERTEVTRLVVPRSRLMVWYAILRHPVLAEGHRPDLVLLPSTLEDLIGESDGEGQDHLKEWVRLASEKPGPGTVLERAQAKGRKLRVKLLAGIRDRAVRWVFGGDRAFAEAALEQVLGAKGAANSSLHVRVVPIVEETSNEENETTADASVGGGALPGSPPPIHVVPGFVQLAREHGAQAVFVRLPVPYGSRPVEPSLERKTLDVCREQGMGYLDLRDNAGERARPGSAEGQPTRTQTLAQQVLLRGLLRSKTTPGSDARRLSEETR